MSRSESRFPDRSDAERRRALERLLDGALPDGTGDEQPEGWGEHSGADEGRRGAGGRDNDDRLRDDVPPHHA